MIVSEINYHSSDDADAGDWFEIKNQLDIPVDLSGWSIRDDDDEHIFTLPGLTVINGGKYMVVCERVQDFGAVHPGVPRFLGDLGFGLGNGGDVLRLYNAGGILQLSICYDDIAPWITEADGNGYTLELSDAYVNLNDPFNWFAGCLGGSPGGPYNPDCIPVSVDLLSSSDYVSIFPNPVDELLTIEVKDGVAGKLQVVDVLGKRIFQQNIISELDKINTSSWHAGIYFVMIEVNGMRMVEKVVKR